MRDDEEDWDAMFEVTPTSDELDGEDKRFAGFTFLVGVTIDPGCKGSFSWNAPSDIDYRGHGPGIEDVVVVLVRDQGAGVERTARPDERQALDRWAEKYETRFNDLAVAAWDD